MPHRVTLAELEENIVEEISDGEIAIFAHIFYDDFVDLLIEGLKTFPRSTAIFVSTTSSKIADRVTSDLSTLGFKSDVRICPNKGRNFGPLFVEFSDKFANFEFVIHIHSKKSLHSDSNLGVEWRNKLVHLLLNYTTVARAVSLLRKESEAGFVTADVTNLIRSHNLRWGRNLQRLMKSRLSSLVDPIDIKRHHLRRLDFPTGGMFLIKSDLLRQVAGVNLRYEDFDAELDQIDGTLSHALERLIGYMAAKDGAKAVVYKENIDKFFLQFPN